MSSKSGALQAGRWKESVLEGVLIKQLFILNEEKVRENSTKFYSLPFSPESLDKMCV